MTLRLGSKGSDVVELQQMLNALGFGPLVEDGDFGKKTDLAVRQYQASQNIVTDGEVGPVTMGRLKAKAGKKPSVKKMDAERKRLLKLIPKDAPGVVRRALELAITDLGAKEDPDGTNTGPEILHLVADYEIYWWILNDSADLEEVKKRGHPVDSEIAPPEMWCCKACMNWIRAALDLQWWDCSAFRLPLEGHPFTYYLGGADQVEDWAKAHGRWITKLSSSTPVPAGALATIGKHILMVLCDNEDGTITTIEGNVSNRVDSYVRKKADLRGYTTWWETA